MTLSSAYGGEGAGFQLFTQSDNNPGIYADAAARDVYFGANPSDLTRLDANEFLIIKLLDDGGGDAAYQQRFASTWLDVTSLVIGPTGAAGATGNSYFFSSIAARDTFFSTIPNEGLLENGLPVIINIGEFTQSTFIWGGVTAPVSYDATLWRLSAAEISSGTLFLGVGGAGISSGAALLNFTAANGDASYVHGVRYDDGGSLPPSFWKMPALSQIPLADLSTQTLSDPQTLSITNTIDVYVKEYTLIPAAAGEIRVQTWLGTDETGAELVDTFAIVEVGDIGVPTVFVAPNNTLVKIGQQTYTKFSGVQLKGDLQTSGPFIGLTVPFVTLGGWVVEQYNFLTTEDGASNLNAIPYFSTTANEITSSPNFTYNEFAFATDITVRPPNSSGSAAFVFNTSGGALRGTFAYGQPGNELLFTVAAATAGGLRFINNSAGNTVIDIRDTSTIFEIIGVNHTAAHPLMSFATSSGDIDVYVGTPSPVGDLSAFGGAFYFRDAELNSGLYVKRSSGAASTVGWTALGDVSSTETTTVINSIATWSNITGDSIQQADNCYAFTSGLVAGIDVDAPSGGTSEFALRNSSSSDRFSIIYNESADRSLLLEQGANGLTVESAVSDVNIISGSAKSVIINGVAVIAKSPVSAQLNLNLPSALGGGGVVITAHTAIDTFVMTYSESARASFITATGTANDLTIQSDVGPILINVNKINTTAILSLSNNTEVIDFYAYAGDPNSVITSDEGDVIVDTTPGGVQIHQRHGSGAGNSYAQVEFLQKRWLAVSTSQTLSRDYNRILLDPNAGDIDLVIPTPANTAQARGFEQTLVKTTNTDDVVKFTNPGFILGSSDTYIMSKYGDSMTYMQTTSRNIMLHETRDPYAIMSRGGSAELSIDGATGSDILLEGFTSDDHAYYGLCEPDNSNDKIQFVNVEDLTNGDLYEVQLNVVGRWTKDYDIRFKAQVDDKGLSSDYQIHILETSDSTTDYQQLNGQGFFRTGINTLGGLDTSVQIVFRLDTAATFWVRTINLQIRKIRG